MIIVEDLRKRFGSVLAVDGLSFSARPGVVTGFLGPNGSGKSTTMRCMLGLDLHESGTATFGGQPYHALRRPLYEVGVLLDAGYVHPGRSGRNHLRWLAASNGIGRARVEAVLEQVGLTQAASRRVKGYSLGMRQRLGLAAVLLGDPHTIVLDEPANGLDPEGVRWIRDVLVHLANQGRTVFVSSHLLSEMALMAQELVVIGRGRLIDQCTLADFVERHTERWVKVRTPQMPALRQALAGRGVHVRETDATTIDVYGVDAPLVGQVAHETGIVLHELSPQIGSLEDAFLRATAGAEEYRTQGGA
jgi:ABC-2 type transport system ATP-binding protein